jgi:hypothetical protein
LISMGRRLAMNSATELWILVVVAAVPIEVLL